MHLSRKQGVFFIGGIGISAVFLWLAIKQVDIKTTVEILKGTNYLYFFPVFLFGCLDFFFRSLRWRALLLPLKKCSIFNIFSIFAISTFATTVLPMRLGELVKIVFLSEKESISKIGVAGSVVMERVFDLLVIFLFLTITVSVFGLLGDFRKFWNYGFMLFLVPFSGMLCLVFIGEKAASAIEKYIAVLSKKAAVKAGRIMRSFLIVFEGIKNVRIFIIVCFLSLTVWSLNSSVFYFMAKSVGITELTYPGAVFIMVITCLGIALPSSPGFIGVFEYFGVIASGALGIDKNRALGFILLLHSVQIFSVVVIGLFFLAREQLSILKLQEKLSVQE